MAVSVFRSYTSPFSPVNWNLSPSPSSYRARTSPSGSAFSAPRAAGGDHAISAPGSIAEGGGGPGAPSGAPSAGGVSLPESGTFPSLSYTGIPGLAIGPTGTISPNIPGYAGPSKVASFLASLLGIPTSINPIMSAFPSVASVLGPLGFALSVPSLTQTIGRGMSNISRWGRDQGYSWGATPSSDLYGNMARDATLIADASRPDTAALDTAIAAAQAQANQDAIQADLAAMQADLAEGKGYNFTSEEAAQAAKHAGYEVFSNRDAIAPGEKGYSVVGSGTTNFGAQPDAPSVDPTAALDTAIADADVASLGENASAADVAALAGEGIDVGGGSYGGGDAGGGGGDCLLMNYALNALKPKEAAQARRFFEAFYQLWMQSQPVNGRKILKIYQAISRRIIAKIEQSPPAMKRQVQQYIYDKLIKPVGPALEPDELVGAVQRLASVVRTLTKTLRISLPAPLQPTGFRQLAGGGA